MPSIDLAMARSIRPGVWTELSTTVSHSVLHFARQTIVEDTQENIDDIGTALSSWDNCMSVNWCQYPVIAIIAVGGLIILAVLWCVIRCACCGVACCCSIFNCLKCCGNCCGCCDPPGSRKHKYLDEPYIPAGHGQGYQTQAPMHAGYNVAPPPQNLKPAPPQYAEFDVSRKGDEDALPVMPSWEGAGNKKVGPEEDVELEHLKKSPVPEKSAMAMDARASPAPQPSPFEQRGFQNNPYKNQPYGSSADMPGMPNNRESVGYGLDQPYDDPTVPPPVPAMPTGRSSPAPSMNSAYGQSNGFGPGYQQNGQPGLDQAMYAQGRGHRGPPPGSRTRPPPGHGPGHGPHGPGPHGPPGAMRRQNTGEDPYAMRRPPPHRDPSGRGSPGPMGPGMRRGPPPGRGTPGPPGGYGNGPHSPRQPRSPHMPSPHRPAAQQSHFQTAELQQPEERPTELPSPGPAPIAAPTPSRPFRQAQPEPPASPIQNNGGFDFTSGFSRPQGSPQQDFDRRPSESRDEREGYPGYKPYPAPQQGWSGV